MRRIKNIKKMKLISCFLIGTFIVRIVVLPNWYFFRYLKNENLAKPFITTEETNVFKVMSYNVRCKTFLDIGKKSWFYRANMVMDDIESVMPDILGLQEVTKEQYRYLKDNLVGYSGIIEYRDSMPWSEGCPVFFNAERYELLESETFWLSETPNKMSKGWGADTYRICTSVILYDKTLNTELAVYNVHLDHKSEEAREKGINLVYEKISLRDNIPSILLGDFNAEETSETYYYITRFFDDVKYKALDSEDGITYHNWGENRDESPIDYIMAIPENFNVDKYSIIRRECGGAYSSDHFPIYAELRGK